MGAKISSQTRVALVKGDERYANVRKALELIEQDIKLEGVEKILIKPNLTQVYRQLATTHVDAVRALLDFLRERTEAEILIAEASGTGAQDAMVGFKNFGYLKISREYRVRFMDLNRDEPIEAQILDWELKPLTVRLAKTVVEADFRISICPPKTHDFLIITASLKNLVMGSILRKENWLATKLLGVANRLVTRTASLSISGKWATRLGNILGNDKMKVHQGYPAMNLSLYKLAKVIPPHLSVIDGFKGMDGQGPVEGDEVDFRIAIASTDFVAADSLVAKLMGFEPDKIGYLVYCRRGGLGEGDLTKINLIGEPIEKCMQSFRPHPTYEMQLMWPIAQAEKYF
jgi:uncharacterized protein (DUF362 family)